LFSFIMVNEGRSVAVPVAARRATCGVEAAKPGSRSGISNGFRSVIEYTERGTSMKSRSGLRQRVLTLAVAAGCGLVCSGGAFAAVPRHSASPVRVAAPVRVAPVQQANATQFVTVSQATHLGHGDRITNTMLLTRQFPITVALKLRNEAQLKAINARPHAPMSRAELTANYLPTAAQADAVKAYLQRAGFRHVSVSPDNLLVRAVGNSMMVKQAFRTTMVNVHTLDGRSAYANNQAVQIPVSLKSTVAAVVGLQTVHEMHTLARQVDATPTVGEGHFTPEFANIYGAASLPAATGIDVAVWGWGPMTQTVTDLQTFLSSSHGAGIVAPTVNVVCTNVGGAVDPTSGDITGGTATIGDPSCGGAPDVGGAIEWNMDSQTILGMTGGVKTLTFYAAEVPSDDGLINSLDEIISPSVGEPTPQVVNASFGGCEKGDTTFTDGMDSGMQAAVALGMTFSISTGDSGFDECGDGGMDSASAPANSPYAVAVSGTTLRTTTESPAAWARENVWFDAGGSPSSVETAQAWQTALTYGPFAGQRGPDVAFDANPGTGAVYYLDGDLVQVGGTSLAAPLFTGAWARILEADQVNTTALGFAAPSLYAVYASDPAAFHDVTAGNNRGDDPVGGYIAQRGWDWATGLGSFDVGQVAADLAQ
jgi:hypothetical protein